MKRLIFSCILLICSAVVFAQSDKSTIRGTVSDSTGAVVPKVEIVATEIATNTRARVVHSDDNGNYEMPDLKPGTYRVRADAPGFKAFIAENVLIEGARFRSSSARVSSLRSHQASAR